MTLYEKLCKKAGEVWYNFVKKEGNLPKTFTFSSCLEVGCSPSFFSANIIPESPVIFIFGFIEHTAGTILPTGQYHRATCGMFSVDIEGLCALKWKLHAL